MLCKREWSAHHVYRKMVNILNNMAVQAELFNPFFKLLEQKFTLPTDASYLGIDMPKIGFSEKVPMTKNFLLEVGELVSRI